MSWSLIPAPGKIVVRQARRDASPAGIILVGRSAEASFMGEVVAAYDAFLGEGNVETEPYFKVGDIVAFGRNSGVTLQVDRDNYTVLREQEILVKLIEVEDPEPVPEVKEA